MNLTFFKCLFMIVSDVTTAIITITTSTTTILPPPPPKKYSEAERTDPFEKFTKSLILASKKKKIIDVSVLVLN